jgi:CBS domain-containing protein
VLASQVAARDSTDLNNRTFLRGTCRDLMQVPSAEVPEDASLAEAMQAMLSADVHGVPVVDAGHRLLGVLTLSDVLRALLAHATSKSRRSMAAD